MKEALNSALSINDMKSNIQKAMESIALENRKKKAEQERRYSNGVLREKRMIELLESIDKNTSILTDVVKLLGENNKDQKQILEIINDLNSLPTINDNNKCKTKYREIMNKISTTLSDVSTINTLFVYAMTIYKSISSISI